MFAIFAAKAAGGTIGTVTVSGEAIVNVGATPIAGIRFNVDGTLDKNEDGAFSQIDAATDWIIPLSSVTKRTFHVSASLNASSGGGTLTGTLDSWIAMSTAPEWNVERLAGQGSGTSTWDLDVSISDDGGSTTLDTGLFEMDATI
jgi:hypothetical protein